MNEHAQVGDTPKAQPPRPLRLALILDADAVSPGEVALALRIAADAVAAQHVQDEWDGTAERVAWFEIRVYRRVVGWLTWTRFPAAIQWPGVEYAIQF